MPHVQLALSHQLLHFLGQFQQPQQVADRRPRPPHRFGGLLVGQRELRGQPLEGDGLLQGIEVPRWIFSIRATAMAA